MVKQFMKQELRQAIKEVLEAWETPDSPEAFACAMYQLRRIYLSDLKARSVSSDVNRTYGRRKSLTKYTLEALILQGK